MNKQKFVHIRERQCLRTETETVSQSQSDHLASFFHWMSNKKLSCHRRLLSLEILLSCRYSSF